MDYCITCSSLPLDGKFGVFPSRGESKSPNHCMQLKLEMSTCTSLMSHYNPRQKSWHACPLLQHLSGKFISSSPSPRFNVVYRDEFVIAHFQHCLGGGGLLFQWCHYYKIACQCIFMLSDSDMPRTFVVDCRPRSCNNHCKSCWLVFVVGSSCRQYCV